MNLEQLNRIGEVSLRYYKQTELNPTEEEFSLWLSGLPDHIAADHRERGLEASKGVLSFKRFQLERKDYGMRDFMQANLSTEDFVAWVESGRDTSTE